MFSRKVPYYILAGLCLLILGFILGRSWVDMQPRRYTGHPFPSHTEVYEAIDPNNQMVVQVTSTVWTDHHVSYDNIVLHELSGYTWKIVPFSDTEPSNWVVYCGQANKNMDKMQFRIASNPIKLEFPQ
jgi:hypothetical protein